MDYGHAEVALQHVDDAHHAPSGAEKIDALRLLAVLQEHPFHMGIDLFAGQIPNLLERHVDSFHAEHIEARIHEIAREGVVDLSGKIRGAHEALHLQRMQSRIWLVPEVKMGVLYFASHFLISSASPA